jgi:lipoate-protein ligase A
LALDNLRGAEVTDSNSWRLILDPPADAAANMARDEALLLSAADGGPVTLRFYAWLPYAFSLGYFQHYREFAPHARRGRPVVRRLTGGGAIWHADEITYSLVGPFGAGGFPRRAAGIFLEVHTAIADGLQALGIDAELSDAPAGRSPSICFSRPQKYDIVVAGRKLLGSAQCRRGRTFLQHGSLPLLPNEFAPGALSVADVVAKRPDDATIIKALSRALKRAFGVALRAGKLTPEEEAAAARLASDRYSNENWNARR